MVNSISGVEIRNSTVIDSHPANKVKGHSGVAGSVFFVTAATEVNGNTFVFSLSTQDTDLEQSLVTEFDQILSTVKFAN